MGQKQFARSKHKILWFHILIYSRWAIDSRQILRNAFPGDIVLNENCPVEVKQYNNMNPNNSQYHYHS